MPSSFTPLLKLELPATGELSGTWGTTVNNAITTPLSEAIAGTTTITVGGSDYTLSNGDGSAANEARKMFIVATGTPGASRNVICPAASKFYVFRNDTNQTLTLKTLSGTGIAVPAGQYRFLYCDGTNVVETFNAMASLTLGTALAAASGGTGQSSYTTGDLLYATGTTALSKLGIGAADRVLTSSGTAPQWVTSLTGLTGVSSSSITNTSLTATRLVYSTTGGAQTDSANLTFDGTSLTLGGNPTFSGGTANGVLYLNASKVATSGSGLVFDGTNLGVPAEVYRTTASSYLRLSGGDGAGSGASVLAFGQSHATNPNRLSLNAPSATATSYIDFNVAGSEAMRLTSTGLGIGTSSPGAKLDVNGEIRVYPSSSPAQIRFGVSGVEKGKLAVDTSSNMVFETANNERMRLDASGNLGIGTTPTTKLDVVGGNNDGLQYRTSTRTVGIGQLSSEAAVYWGSTTDLMFFSGSELMRITGSGNLGIGTTSPASRLDVNGVISIGGQTAVQSKVYGYSGSYYAVQIGAPGSNATSVALAVDVSTVAGGGFQGQNQVILPSNGALFVNAAGTDFIGAIRRDSSNRILIGPNVSAGLTVGDVVVDASGNLGLGVTPSAWVSTSKALQILPYASVSCQTNGAANFGFNFYESSGNNFSYTTTDQAGRFSALTDGSFAWYTAPSGTAGNAISFTQAMTLDASGNLTLGQTSSALQSGGTGITIYGSSASELKFLNSTTGQAATDGTALVTSGSDFVINNREAGAITFGTNNQERARITSGGNFVVGTAALATNATDGFLYVPTCAGTPTGTPTTQTGTAPIVVDTTNNKLYFYSGGQWRDAGP